MSLEDAGARADPVRGTGATAAACTAAADALGLSRSAMYRRLQKLGLRPDEL